MSNLYLASFLSISSLTWYNEHTIIIIIIITIIIIIIVIIIIIINSLFKVD